MMRGLFGRNPTYYTPGIGDGFNERISTMGGAPVDAAEVPAPAYKRPSTGQMIAGTIGDALLSWGGGRPVFTPAMQTQQQAAMEQAQYQRRQADQWAMWQRQKEWERDNPAPINNDTVNDYNFRAQTLGKPAADEWLKSASDPVVTVTLPGNRVYSGPRSGLADALGTAGGGAAQTPTAPVGKLKPIGGAGPIGSRTFPLR